MKNTNNTAATKLSDALDDLAHIKASTLSYKPSEAWVFGVDRERYSEDVIETVYELEISSAQGSPEHQYTTGHMYYVGIEVPEDMDRAVYWLKMAAKRGCEGAQYDLGFMYYRGYGVEYDNAKAAIFLKMAARQGFATAQCDIGLMYLNGYGVKVNCKRAAYWFRRAAKQNNKKAKYCIAVMEYFCDSIEDVQDLAAFCLNKIGEIEIAEDMYDPQF